MNDDIRNTQIKGTSIFWEDHGWLLACVDTGSGSFGGFDLSDPRLLGHFIQKVIEVFGTWDKLAGMPCRIRIENHMLVAIGHFIEDRWFTPALDMPWSE